MERQAIYFDSTFLNNKTGIGRDSRAILKALKNSDKFNIIELNPYSEIFKKVHLHNILSTQIQKKLINLISLILKRPIFFEIPENSWYFMAHIHSVFPKGQFIKRVVRVHDIFPLTNPEWFKRGSIEIFRNSIFEFKSTDFALCNSKYSANQFSAYLKVNGLSLPKISVLNCYYQKIEANKCGMCSACKSEVNFQNYLLAVGTVEPRKNYESLLSAWQNVENKSNFNQLIIAGKYGWKTGKRRFRKQVKESGAIWFENVCDGSIGTLMADARAFISASLNEGFNLPLAEAALLCGFILASDIEVHRELHEKYIDVFFRPNIVEIAQAILESSENMKGRQLTNLDISKRFSSELDDFLMEIAK